VRESAESGESISRFCEKRGIRRNQYIYWQRKLRETVCKELISPKEEKAGEGLTVKWAVAEIGVAMDKKADELTVEICGCKIEVKQSTDSELLAKTCRVLRSLC
jgi:transposase-like protein